MPHWNVGEKVKSQWLSIKTSISLYSPLKDLNTKHPRKWLPWFPPTALLPPNSLAQRLHTSRSNRHLVIPQLDQAKKSHTPPSAFSTLQKKLCNTWYHLCENLTVLAEAVNAWFWIALCHYTRWKKNHLLSLELGEKHQQTTDIDLGRSGYPILAKCMLYCIFLASTSF